MKNYKAIKYQELEEGISIVSLNRPEKLNAFTIQMIEELHDLFNKLEWDLDVRVLILTGEGRAFSAGTDLNESTRINMPEVPEEYRDIKYMDIPEISKRQYYGQKRASQLVLRLREIPQPIIAAIKGPAVGMAFAISLAADIRIAGESARFRNSVFLLGLSGVDIGNSYFLPRLIGLSRAAEIIYTARFVDAQEAERIGLVSRVVPDEKLMDEAIALAKVLVAKSPLGLRLTKSSINVNINAPNLESALAIENRTQALCMNTTDPREGITAFFEKRDPKYPRR
ncbi:MAG: enoyl-CoA hydratase/isomerase family protein [Candidatus Jordarchaeum sp.]|uniref:enoyl-CoA hydratase/isomerase family protein n=1 Tax=Candidatus Jordarchaeum sp. TaxID=2823881 RepID=UPI00404AF395